MQITTSPNRRNTTYDCAHGVSVRWLATTYPVTTTISARSNGFVVRLAAVPNPNAQTHQAPGCNPLPQSLLITKLWPLLIDSKGP
jgi:hypothetical protein